MCIDNIRLRSRHPTTHTLRFIIIIIIIFRESGIPDELLVQMGIYATETGFCAEVVG